MRSANQAARSENRADPQPQAAARHLLHVFPGFGVGGVELRIASIINHFGDRYRHTIAAMNDTFTSADRLDPDLGVTLLPLGVKGGGTMATLKTIRTTLRRLRPDLLLSYNWGAVEWAAVNGLLGGVRHIHLESGFGPDEADRQLPRRVLIRRLALRRIWRLVVPSHNLRNIAKEVWHIAPEKIVLIPNGVDIKRFAEAPAAALPGLARRPGELIIGTVAPLRREKNIPRLIKAFAALGDDPPCRLVIVGDGVERATLAAAAQTEGVADRVVFTGYLKAPETALALMDVYALSSDTEQMPNTLIQAMAAGLPVAATAVGDVARIVADANRAYVAAPGDEPGFAAALARLANDGDLRRALGQANRDRVREQYDQTRMFDAYAALYDA
jgi:glycosyltransferase involved in cell wall biosynthesis